MLLKSLKTSLVMFVLMTVLLGVAYPVGTTGIIQGLFTDKANGSLIVDAGGTVRGSGLIGQSFTKPEYFWSRPSAVSYNAAASGGSNYGVNNPDLQKAVQGRIEALQAADPTNKAVIPVDLVTASGSGLDPHISEVAAQYQAARVAHTRKISPEAIKGLIKKYTEGRTLGILGEPVVNVLKLNMALDNHEFDRAE